MGDRCEEPMKKKRKRPKGTSTYPETSSQGVGESSVTPKEKKIKRKGLPEGTRTDPEAFDQGKEDGSEKPKEKKRRRKRQSKSTSMNPEGMGDHSEKPKQKKRKRKQLPEGTSTDPEISNQGVGSSCETPKEKQKKRKGLPKGTCTDPETFDQGDVLDSFKVKYKVVRQIDRRTFEAFIQRKDGDRWYDVTIQLYKQKDEALHVYSITKSPPAGSSIIKAQWLDLPKGGYPTIIFEKFYPLTFEDWLAKLQTFQPKGGTPGIWLRKEDGTILSLAKEVRSALKDIVAGLQLLHDDGKYHGQLATGMRISNFNRLQLVNFKQRGSSEQGIMDDLHQLSQLVGRVCALDANGNAWIGFRLFQELENVFRQQGGGLAGSLKKYAFFTYISPFFHDESDRYQLFIKLLEFRKLNAEDFSRMVSLSEGLTEIANWQAQANGHGRCGFVFSKDSSPTSKAAGTSKKYLTKPLIVRWFKNCLKHVVGNTECEILETLHNTFPDVIHKLFLNFVQTIGVNGTFQGHEVIPLFRKGVAAFY